MQNAIVGIATRKNNCNEWKCSTMLSHSVKLVDDAVFKAITLAV